MRAQIHIRDQDAVESEDNRILGYALRRGLVNAQRLEDLVGVEAHKQALACLERASKMFDLSHSAPEAGEMDDAQIAALRDQLTKGREGAERRQDAADVDAHERALAALEDGIVLMPETVLREHDHAAEFGEGNAQELERRGLAILDDESRHAMHKRAATERAKLLAADAVNELLSEMGKSANFVTAEVGMAGSRISEITKARSKEGPRLWSLCLIARALNKRLNITFE